MHPVESEDFTGGLFHLFDRHQRKLLAEAVTGPRTSAVIVAMSPTPTLTVSRDSTLRLCSGKMARNHIPNSAPANVHMKTITPAIVGFMLWAAILSCSALVRQKLCALRSIF
jgi:hypothetical protein